MKNLSFAFVDQDQEESQQQEGNVTHGISDQRFGTGAVGAGHCDDHHESDAGRDSDLEERAVQGTAGCRADRSDGCDDQAVHGQGVESRAPVARTEEFVVSGKTLRRGDTFRAKGGPYFRSSSGSRTKMAERGPFKFLAHCEQGDQRWLEAVSSGGGFTILSLTERKNAMMPDGYVARPYRIVAGGRRSVAVAADDADIEDATKGRRGRPDKADRKAAREAARSRRERGGMRGAIGRALAGDGAGGGPEAAGGAFA